MSMRRTTSRPRSSASCATRWGWPRLDNEVRKPADEWALIEADWSLPLVCPFHAGREGDWFCPKMEDAKEVLPTIKAAATHTVMLHHHVDAGEAHA